MHTNFSPDHFQHYANDIDQIVAKAHDAGHPQAAIILSTVADALRALNITQDNVRPRENIDIDLTQIIPFPAHRITSKHQING